MGTENVIEQYISSITSSFDPHTSYMSRGSFDNFMIQMNLELDGIGATLQASDEGYTVINSLVEGGASKLRIISYILPDKSCFCNAISKNHPHGVNSIAV